MIEACPKRNIIFKFLVWHFFEAPKGILKGWRNFSVFNFHYFSILQLSKTLFSHWRRYREFYGRGFDPKRYFWAFSSNLISRVLGAIVRTVTIIIGLIVEVFIFISGIFVFLSWLFLPILLILGLFYGLKFLI
ncbi:MAG: hypothetical protein QMC93_00015 [Patescibacteria group bacterium]|nr:hypothetical protein [Patescibacteria group bacterium]